MKKGNLNRDFLASKLLQACKNIAWERLGLDTFELQDKATTYQMGFMKVARENGSKELQIVDYKYLPEGNVIRGMAY